MFAPAPAQVYAQDSQISEQAKETRQMLRGSIDDIGMYFKAASILVLNDKGNCVDPSLRKSLREVGVYFTWIFMRSRRTCRAWGPDVQTYQQV